MQRPDFELVLNAMQFKGHRVYDTPTVDWNLNIVGIRAATLKPDKFDDWLLVFHRFGGEWDVRYYQITTDPSPYYLKNPVNSAGTAVLVPGQYRGVYALDTHNRGRPGAHKALCQRLGDVSVYRDRNLDGQMNLDAANVQTGSFGINIHRGPRNGQWTENNTNYSAGCQVFADDRKFSEFLLLCEHAANSFGNKFTYTLLREQDLHTGDA
jgi:hypothetical protein